MAEPKTRQSEMEAVRLTVAAYVAAGADESVQRVVTAVHRLARRLNQWYDRQLADLDISTGEWGVLSELARIEDGHALTPSQLAAAANVAPSSMTHRLDRMVERRLVSREPDPANRTRVLVRMTDDGWQLYASAIRESNVVEAEVISGLSEDQVAELAFLLERVIAGLDHADL
ncbi:MAG TPA: MarR family transcriptional regulator [Propionibacteriaceae bacterium]|jgi:DNA-binding MarR family transcriptional regulator